MERVKNGRLRQWISRLAPQNGLTRRWLRNAFFLIVVFLLALQILFTIMLRFYYYQSAENSLANRAQLHQRTMEVHWGADTLLSEEVSREIIANFEDKDKMELQVVDADGGVLLSSNGFVPSVTKTPDFRAALSSPEGQGVWQGYSDGGEPVMRMTEEYKHEI